MQEIFLVDDEEGEGSASSSLPAFVASLGDRGWLGPFASYDELVSEGWKKGHNLRRPAAIPTSTDTLSLKRLKRYRDREPDELPEGWIVWQVFNEFEEIFWIVSDETTWMPKTFGLRQDAYAEVTDAEPGSGPGPR